MKERVDWLKLLLPIYDPGEHCIQSFFGTGIAIGFQYVADEPDCYVTTAPLTVEADGEGIEWRVVGTVLLWPSYYSWSPLVHPNYRQEWTLDKRKACKADASCDVTL